jgi:serine/threonine protein phosphatase PrpC
VLTTNHRLAVNAQERARVVAAGGRVARGEEHGLPSGPYRAWPGGLAIGRTLGDVDAPHCIDTPDVASAPLKNGTLVVCSDGVWDKVSHAKAAKIVRATDASSAAHRLVRGATDDATAVVVQFGSMVRHTPLSTLRRTLSSSSSSSEDVVWKVAV